MLKSYGWGGGPLDFSDNPESKFPFPFCGLDSLDLGLKLWIETGTRACQYLKALFNLFLFIDIILTWEYVFKCPLLAVQGHLYFQHVFSSVRLCSIRLIELLDS